MPAVEVANYLIVSQNVTLLDVVPAAGTPRGRGENGAGNSIVSVGVEPVIVAPGPASSSLSTNQTRANEIITADQDLTDNVQSRRRDDSTIAQVKVSASRGSCDASTTDVGTDNTGVGNCTAGTEASSSVQIAESRIGLDESDVSGVRVVTEGTGVAARNYGNKDCDEINVKYPPGLLSDCLETSGDVLASDTEMISSAVCDTDTSGVKLETSDIVEINTSGAKVANISGDSWSSGASVPTVDRRDILTDIGAERQLQSDIITQTNHSAS